MIGFKIIVFILVSCIVAPSSFADIYEWTDENGVKHFSNYAYPAESKVLMKTKEEPYDAEADRARMEIDRQELLEFARQEIVQREIELELREAEAERKIAEADRMAEATLREADDYREETGSSRVIYRVGGYGCLDGRYGCNDSLYDRWYYRKKFSRSHHKKLNHLSPYQRYRYTKKLYGPVKNKNKQKYRDKTRHRQKRNFSTVNLNSRGTTHYRDNRIGSRSNRTNGRGNSSRRGSSLGIRR